MASWICAALFVVGACYAPSAHEGARCSSDGHCPRGLSCATATDTCELPRDAAIDAEVVSDVPLDTVDVDIDAACTGTMTLQYTGAIVTFAVPACASSIGIEAWGAQGGNGETAMVGGKGAHATCRFAVAGGPMLRVLVGGKGIAGVGTQGQAAGTGGGGSFVADGSNNPMIVAGGGGGATLYTAATADGGPGQATADGQIGGGTTNPGVAGTNGGGGGTHPNGGFHAGTGGGGFTGDGQADSGGNVAQYGSANGRGKAFINGGDGGVAGSQGRAGGFGGGGAAGYTGGGGGGYSGGGSGSATTPTYGGGGGGSFCSNPNGATIDAGVNTGNGRVIISW